MQNKKFYFIRNLLILCVFMLIHTKDYGQTLNVGLVLTQAPCDHDGIITANVVGGVPPYTYTWSGDGQSSVLVTSSSVFNGYAGANTIYVIVKDANGISGSQAFLPTGVPFSIQMDWANTYPSVCPLNNGGLAISTTGGSAPFSYSWYDNGNFIATTNLPMINGLAVGNSYDVEVTDANGCKLFAHEALSSFMVLQDSVNFIAPNFNISQAKCNDGIAIINPVGGLAPYTYSWYETTPINQQFLGNNDTITNLIANHTYSVGIIDANGCSRTIPFTMSNFNAFYATVTKTPVSCSANTGAIDVSIIPQAGTSLAPPYIYSWSNNTVTSTPTLSNLGAGNYYCNIVDANGCSSAISTYLGYIQNISLTLSTSHTTNCINPNGTATVVATGGVSPYTYSWSTGATTATISGLSSNTTYSVFVTDANGCSKQQTFTVPYANQGYYSVYTTVDMCGTSNGTANVNATNGGVQPFSYSWSNGQTTQIATNLAAGSVQCTITDANGCTLNLLGNPIVAAYSSISISATITNAACLTSTDGSITATGTNGTPPYQYEWYGMGQTSPTINNLAAGNYYLKVTDATGCSKTQSFQVGYNGLWTCTGKIRGFVYVDANQNCIKDAGEQALEGVQVYCLPYGGSKFTNGQGYYEFNVPLGNYQIQHFPLQYYTEGCNAGIQNVSVISSNSNNWVNFGEGIIPTQDLRIDVYGFISTPQSLPLSRVINIKNVGTIPVNMPFLHLHETSTPNPTLNVPSNFNVAGTDYYTVALQPLNPTQIQSFDLTYPNNLNLPFGTVATFLDSITPNTNGDATPWNNIQYSQTAILAPYDPNYKEVFPKGKGDEGFITKDDSILEYVIHFQNTGNAPAINVVLKDTLDSDLDLNSIEMGYGTHAYTTELSLDNVLKITFPNINLVDSFTDVQASMGFVAFRIKQKKNLPMGTKFTNAADIYFDFNYPIHTNTVLNTLSSPTSVNPDADNFSLKVYPNPTKDKLNVLIPTEWQAKEKELSVRCLDILGKEVRVKVQENEGMFILDTQSLPNGWYFLQMTDGKLLLTQKFVVVK